jgi:hypothetical protein
MKAVPRRSAASAAGLPRRRIRSRTEAAGELVRLEYERERLTIDIAQTSDRLAASKAALGRVEARMAMLQDHLSVAAEAQPAALPVAPAPTLANTSAKGAVHANARYRR